MRALYTLLLYVLVPFVLVRLAWRGMRAPAYWKRWNERFSVALPPVADTRPIWVHAVSVGEVQAALPLVAALRDLYAEVPILFTTTTPTGAAQVEKQFGASVQHRYIPYDLPGAVARFFICYQPRFALIMETELWPNLFHACRQREIPLLLANARLSARSAKGYARVRTLAESTLRQIDCIAAQSEQDAQRFRNLGAQATQIRVIGNTKFDVSVPASLRETADVLRREWGVQRPVWIAGSTHEGEEEQVLNAFAGVREIIPDALLVLVPRHPERFARVATLCRGQGFATCLRSEATPRAEEFDVYLGDTMGELALLYAASDVAFVGGSLVDTGGHNPLEPAALGLPVVFGMHMFNFADISRLLLEADAALQVRDSDALALQVSKLLEDANRRHQIGANGLRVVAANRGAKDAVLNIVNELLT